MASAISSSRRVVATALVLSAATIVLTGCLPADGKVSIATFNGNLQVAVCEELVVEEALADVREPGADSEVRFWEAVGQVTIPAGTEVSLQDNPFGMDQRTFIEPNLSGGTRVWFTFIGQAGRDTGARVEFLIPESGLRDGVWLTNDGNVQQSPCE